ncbi:MAG: hypothetical protein M0Z99_22425 [Betaproteobacteria bacterium]|nr:hypothetical protein [Betaproteobacteria bacterium]
MPTLGSFEIGRLISIKAIPQIAAAAGGSDCDPEFWRAFVAGISGAMAASIGFDAAEKVLQDQLGFSAEARQLINRRNH